VDHTEGEVNRALADSQEALNVSETYQSISACIPACGYLLCRNAPIPKALIATDMVGDLIRLHKSDYTNRKCIRLKA